MGRLCFVNAWRWLQLIHSNRMPSTWLMRVKLNLLLPITPINFISFCYTDALLIIGSRGNWGVCCRFLFYLEGREWGKNFLLLYDWLPLCRFFISLVTRHLSNPPLPTPSSILSRGVPALLHWVSVPLPLEYDSQEKTGGSLGGGRVDTWK